MHCIDLPAGSAIRLTATAHPNVGVHRWDIRVLDAGAPAHATTPRLTYGSQIGGGDCEQRIDIPAQDVDCRLEVNGRHSVGHGWKDDRWSVYADAADCLQIGFPDRRLPESRKDDVLLSFSFDRGRPQEGPPLRG